MLISDCKRPSAIQVRLRQRPRRGVRPQYPGQRRTMAHRVSRGRRQLRQTYPGRGPRCVRHGPRHSPHAQPGLQHLLWGSRTASRRLGEDGGERAARLPGWHRVEREGAAAISGSWSSLCAGGAGGRRSRMQLISSCPGML